MRGVRKTKGISRKVFICILEVLFIMSLIGCGAKKYNVDVGSYGFEAKKTKYAPGEKVTVYYTIIATDTDYYFSTDSDDVTLKTSYDDKHGYVLTFTMPDHDVKMIEDSRNSMEYDPDAHGPASYDPDADNDPENTDSKSSDQGEETETWFCPECGAKNNRVYCADCGSKKPEK